MTLLDRARTQTSEVRGQGRRLPLCSWSSSEAPSNEVLRIRREAYPDIKQGRVSMIDEFDLEGTSRHIRLVRGGHAIFAARLTPVRDGHGPLSVWLARPEVLSQLPAERGELTRFAAGVNWRRQGLLPYAIKATIAEGARLGLSKFAWLLEEGAGHCETFCSTGAETIAEGLMVKGTDKRFSLHLLDLKRPDHLMAFVTNFYFETASSRFVH